MGVAVAARRDGSPAAAARRLIIARTTHRSSARPVSRRPAGSTLWKSAAFGSSSSPAAASPDRAHPPEAVEHDREQRAVPVPGQRARVDRLEELPRLRRREDRRRALRDDVLRPPPGSSPSTSTAPRRPASRQTHAQVAVGTVRVSRASVRKVPSTKARRRFASVGRCATIAPAPSTAHTQRRGASRPTTYRAHRTGSAPTVKQHLAAILMLGDRLVVSQVLPVNRASAVPASTK